MHYSLSPFLCVYPTSCYRERNCIIESIQNMQVYIQEAVQNYFKKLQSAVCNFFYYYFFMFFVFFSLLNSIFLYFGLRLQVLCKVLWTAGSEHAGLHGHFEIWTDKTCMHSRAHTHMMWWGKIVILFCWVISVVYRWSLHIHLDVQCVKDAECTEELMERETLLLLNWCTEPNLMHQKKMELFCPAVKSSSQKVIWVVLIKKRTLINSET